MIGALYKVLLKMTFYLFFRFQAKTKTKWVIMHVCVISADCYLSSSIISMICDKVNEKKKKAIIYEPHLLHPHVTPQPQTLLYYYLCVTVACVLCYLNLLRNFIFEIFIFYLYPDYIHIILILATIIYNY
jgi:hypothetical protein